MMWMGPVADADSSALLESRVAHNPSWWKLTCSSQYLGAIVVCSWPWSTLWGMWIVRLFQKSVEQTVATFAPARWLKLVLNRCQRSSWQEFWVLRFIIWAWLYYLPWPPICVKGLWEQGYDTLNLSVDDSEEELFNNLCAFLDVLSVI